jgi:hypothetical protein
MDEKKLKKLRITGTQHHGHDQGSITIGELTPEEMETIEAFTLGSCWIRTTEDGRVERRERFAELPDPVADPYQPPKWISAVDWSKEAPFLCNPNPPLPEEPKPTYEDPGIIVRYLCGYNNTPYEWEARKLQSYGFECLRSRRGLDGRFYEVWFLPSRYFAKGDLKDAIDTTTFKDGLSESANRIKTAVDFLCRHVSFGTLDVCYQRAAMCID